MSTRDESPDVPESADQSSWDADLNELECEFEPRAPPAVDLLCGCAPQHDPPSPRTPGTPGRKQPFESAWHALHGDGTFFTPCTISHEPPAALTSRTARSLFSRRYVSRLAYISRFHGASSRMHQQMRFHRAPASSGSAPW